MEYFSSILIMGTGPRVFWDVPVLRMFLTQDYFLNDSLNERLSV